MFCEYFHINPPAILVLPDNTDPILLFFTVDVRPASAILLYSFMKTPSFVYCATGFRRDQAHKAARASDVDESRQRQGTRRVQNFLLIKYLQEMLHMVVRLIKLNF